MWRTGVTRRRRHSALAEMVRLAERTGDCTTPWRASPRIWEWFQDEGDILRQLQHDWRLALAGAVYVAIDTGHGDLPGDVAKALRLTTSRYAGTRAILEANADHPSIARAMRKERALLSGFAGAAPAGAVTAA